MGKETVNLWNRITVYCDNHDIPVKMRVAENLEKIKTPFYACEHYFPEGQDEQHPYCPNRLNLDDYQGLVMKLMEEISEAPIAADFTHYKFSYKGTRQKIDVRVIRYDDKEIQLAIKNRSVLG